MPVRVNEFVIQARFDCGGDDSSGKDSSSGVSDSSSDDNLNDDLLALKEEIISECMEKFEALLLKREGR